MGRYITPQSPSSSSSSHDVLLAINDPGPEWVEQGTVQLQSEHPNLFAKTGLLPDAPAGEFWTPFTPETPISGGLGTRATAFWLTEQTALFCVNQGNSSKIFRTADGGMNWAQVYSGPMTAAARLDGNTALVCANNQILRSTDGGLTWSLVHETYYTSDVLTGIFRFSPSRLIVLGVTNNGAMIAYISTDNGVTFSNLSSSGLNSATILHTAVFSPTEAVVIARSHGDSQIRAYYTADGGALWPLVMPSNIQGFTCCAALTDKIGFLATASKIYRTTDAGKTWGVTVDISNMHARAVIRTGNDTVIVVGYRSYFSSDTGKTWTYLPSLDITPTNTQIVDFSIPNGPAFVLNGYNNKWHRSLPAYNYDPATHFRAARVMEGVHDPLKVYQRAG